VDDDATVRQALRATDSTLTLDDIVRVHHHLFRRSLKPVDQSYPRKLCRLKYWNRDDTAVPST
jgi:hypothetical protein